MSTQHFLRLDDISASNLLEIINRAIELKRLQRQGSVFQPLINKSLAMLFTKSSTRTRVSFEVGMRQLGGGSLNLSPNDTQIGRGEPIEDTARVISSMVDGVMIRTDSHALIEKFAKYSSVPVINGLTDDFHPCQILADMQTLMEHRGHIDGAKIAWIGDGNNVCHSFMNAARLFNFQLHIATPKGYEPKKNISELNSQHLRFFDSANKAAKGCDVVVTDTWASMGQEDQKNEREAAFKGYCVDQKLFQQANKNALFMHCLPAYRGLEVSADVIDGSNSVVFEEAENRLHAQKSLLEFLLS